ncbi:MAG: HAMP domain-containing histidine kinase [Elusimicrobia bacterium]|nr:HAMP domain-containing histidine kinase [Elusimicrobiota bacterium]
MRLGHKIFLLSLAVILPLGYLLERHSLRAVHEAMVRNISAPARAGAVHAARSTAVGLASRDRKPLREYLKGCLSGFAAEYAAAADAEGRVAAREPERAPIVPDGERLSGLPERMDRLFSREVASGGRRYLELVIPAAAESGAQSRRGLLILGFSLEEVAATEARVLKSFFVFAAAAVGAALAVYWILMSMIIRREEELSRKDRMLLQSEKLSALGRLAAGIAHEINNPLGSILVYAQAAGEKVPAADPLSEPLRAIAEEALRAKRLVSDLLAFSRRGESVTESFRLDDSLKAALAMVETQARLKGVELGFEPGFGGELRGHRGQVQQAVVNLCNNSIDATTASSAGGGRITVRTRPSADGRSAVVEVEDTGVGIPLEIQQWVFEPFFTTKEVGQGTGLGLALVYEIATRHGGAVEFESAPGRGTLFRMTLPIMPSGVGASTP